MMDISVTKLQKNWEYNKSVKGYFLALILTKKAKSADNRYAYTLQPESPTHSAIV